MKIERILLRQIRLPLVLPTLGLVTILTFVANFNAFDLIYTVKGALAGPNYSTDLLGTLSSEDEFSLSLAAQVALPILRRLNENASIQAAGQVNSIEAYCADQASALQDLQGRKS